ncbi:hypothetical protein AC249_AIPGENE22957 [Exaiptasia diaphana]|nr:hypothetical protein AC249_AIPGENE22957 [Exaiptasia diaphana]
MFFNTLKGGATGRCRFTDQQKKYLTDLFILGEQTGRKADPDNVSKAMRKARNTDGTFLFQSDDYLTSKQITGFFSRLSSKKTLHDAPVSTIDDDDLEDVLPEIDENQLEQMREEVFDEILVKHPIIYDSYNIYAFEGSISDNEITIKSGLLDKLKPNDAVMADRGFTIREVLAKQNIRLVIPHFLSEVNPRVSRLLSERCIGNDVTTARTSSKITHCTYPYYSLNHEIQF